MFEYRPRRYERTSAFNVVILVPTGIDCAVGGHAGDATAVARLMAQSCDHLILHPNVVNASDINEQPDNALYVEGSLITRLMMGSVALRKVRNNRILAVTESRHDSDWAIDQVVNTAQAVCFLLGARCSEVAVLSEPLSLKMRTGGFGRATGEIKGLERLFRLLSRNRDRYDAVAISSKISVDGEAEEVLQTYFRGDGPNPWGGVEAALTHAVSLAFDVPSAHAPTLEDVSLRTQCFGVTDPRKSAEALSTAFAYCIFKGLQRSPAVVRENDGRFDPAVLAAEDISCLIVPNGCLGLPVIAALLQRIPVVVVTNNTSLMANDLSQLDFVDDDQVHFASSYCEAAGIALALRAGIDPSSTRRPLRFTTLRRDD